MKSLKAGEEALKRNVNRACGRDTQTEEDRETSERASERTAGVYASKVSYGVTSDELTSRQWGSYTPHTRAHCWHTGLRRNRARTHTHTLCAHSGYVRFEGAPPPPPSKNLSVEAGNAIEVITSLITTLHAIRDREFVFHERTASTVHPFPVLTSPTLSFPSRALVYVGVDARGRCSRAFACPNNVRGRPICS